jgi:hypothetical protein
MAYRRVAECCRAEKLHGWVLQGPAICHSFAACDERRTPSSYVVFAADVPGRSRVPAASTTTNLRIDPPIPFYIVSVPTYD